MKSVGVNVGAFYAVTKEIDIMFMVSVNQLLGDAADSPITKEDFSPNVSFTISYNF